MPNFIDRRLNPKDKSLGNRQRFLRRAREELKRSIKDQITTGKIADVDAEHAVPMPRKRHRRAELPDAPATAAAGSMSCPATRTSRRATASPSPARAAAARAQAPAHGGIEDDFRFVLSREEVLDLFFEDLELPDMVKLNLKESRRLQAAPGRLRRRPARRPTSMSAAPCATAMAAASRCRRPKTGRARRDRATRSRALEAEAEPERGRSASASQPLREELERLERRRRLIAYVDPGRYPLQPLRAPAACRMPMRSCSA